MANLRPFWIVSARGVGIRHRDRELWDVVFGGPQTWHGVDEDDLGLLFRLRRVDRVAVFGFGVCPGDGDCEEWVEGIDYCRDDFCFLQPAATWLERC